MAASGSVKFYGFHTGGRAEISCLVLFWAGKDFDEVFITPDQWPDIKQTMPFRQVPVLEIDGQKYNQSVAMAAYLAREFGLYGKTNLDSFKIDMVAQTVYDFRSKAIKYNLVKEPAAKEALFRELSSNEAPIYLAYLERQLIANGGKFMAGDSVTLGDLLVYDLFKNQLGKFVTPNAEKFPNLQKLVDYIDNCDEIKTYKSKGCRA